MNNDLRPINTISNFKRFCMTIGELPTSYLETMTYYEMLVWFTEYMKNTIIPTINNNGLAVQELQDKYIELKSYVDDYFTNLDVQQEINNKLDAMAESGQLTDIIAQYLGLAGILVFNTINDMKNATNLVNGSSVKTLGFYNINDKGGAYYKIRTITNEDVIDEMTIIALNDETLIAELILEDTMNNMQLGIIGDGITDVYQKLNTFFGLNILNYELIDGEYLIDGDLSLTSNSKIYSKNSIIRRKTNSLNTYFMLNVGNIQNVVIDGLHLIGDKDTHTGTSGEWGYGIHVYGSTNVVIKNTIIEKTWGDGIYIGYKYSEQNPQPCDNITIDNCKVVSCSRNGYSICAGKYIKLLNSYCTDVKRIEPKSGIDIESEGPDGVDLILDFIEVINFTSEGNTYGITTRINNDFNSIVISNHKSVNEAMGLVIFGINNKGNMIYENSNIIKSRSCAISITKKNNNLLTLRNIVIDSRTISDNTHNYLGAIQINTNSADSGNIIIDDIKLVKSFSDLYEYQDIICETGTGTLTLLDLYNIFSKKYLCLNNASNNGVTLNNCKFYSTSIGATINLDEHTIFNLVNIYEPLGDATYRNIKNNLPDGTYEIQLSNNTVPFFMYIVFDSEYTVYTADSQTAVSNTHRTSTKGGYMKFIKYGNIITILESTFTPYTA